MKAVILAAGEGTRLGPFTVSEPKVMIPVANRPILEYVVDALVANGIRDIVMVVGYKKERIMSHFEDGKDLKARVEYVVQKKQLGTAHALQAARDLIEEDFLLLPGDNLIDATAVGDLLENRDGPSILVAESERPSKYGVVEVSGGLVKRIVEKPEERIGNLISTSICALPADIFGRVGVALKQGKYKITDVLSALAAEGQVRGIFTDGRWVDAVYPWDLLGVNAAALETLPAGTAGTVEDGVTLKGAVSIGEGSIIRAGTYIQGPVAIGAGCDIGPHVCLFPSTSVGDNCRLAPFTVVEQSLIMAHAAIGPGSHLSHTVVGDGVRTGAQFSAPAGAADATVEGEFHRLESVGAFVGEDAALGSGVVVDPGTIVGARCNVGAHVRVSRNVPNGSILV